MTLKKLRALESGPPQVKGIFKHAQQTFKTMLTMLCMFRLKIGQLTIAVSTVDRKMAIKYNPPRIRDIRYLCRIYTLVNRMFETKGIFWQQKRFSLVGQCDLLLRLLRDTTQRLNYRSMDGNDVMAGLNSQSASSCLYACLSVSTTVGCVTLFGTSSRFLGPAPHFFCPLFSQLQRKWNTPRRVLSVLLLWHISQIGTQAKETGLKD